MIPPMDIRVETVQPEHHLIALLVLAVIAASLVFIRWRLSYVNLSERQKIIKRTLHYSKTRQTPTTRQISQDDENVIQRLWDTESTESVNGDSDETMRDATVTLLETIQRGIDQLLSPLPGFAVRLIQIAAGITVFGSVAVSTTAVTHILTQSPEYPSPPSIIDTVSTATTAVTETAATVLTVFPYGDILISLGFATLVLIAELLYQHWYYTATILLVGAVVITVLDREIDRISTSIIKRKSHTAATVTAGLVGIWTAGVLPAVIGEYVGAGSIGSVIGFVFASIASLWMLAKAVQRLWYNLSRTATDFWTAELDLFIVAYLVVRRVWGVFAVSVSPLVIVYFVVGLTSGAVTDVASAVVHASTDVKILLTVSGLVLGASIVYQARLAWSSIRAAVRNLIARQKVRAFALKGVLPVLVIVMTGTAMYGLTRSPVYTILVATAAGIGVRFMHLLGRKALFAIPIRESDSTGRSTVTVQAYMLETGVDEVDEVLYAVIDGQYEVMAEDVDEITTEIATIVSNLFEDGSADPRLSMLYAEWAFDYGVIGDSDVERKAEEKIRKRVWNELRAGDGSVDRETLESVVEKYPSELVEERMCEWRQRGYIRESNGVIEVRHDPWRRDNHGGSTGRTAV